LVSWRWASSGAESGPAPMWPSPAGALQGGAARAPTTPRTRPAQSRTTNTNGSRQPRVAEGPKRRAAAGRHRRASPSSPAGARRDSSVSGGHRRPIAPRRRSGAAGAPHAQERRYYRGQKRDRGSTEEQEGDVHAQAGRIGVEAPLDGENTPAAAFSAQKS